MKKRGFTLVELLAVIVILAVIAMIAVPTLLNLVEESRKGAFKDSVLSAHKQLEFFLSDKESVAIPEEGIDVTTIGLKHNKLEGLFKPLENGEGMAYYITDGRYCAYGPMDELIIQKGCSNLDVTQPEISAAALVVKSDVDSISVILKEGFAKDEESKLKQVKINLYEEDINARSIENYRLKKEITFQQNNRLQNSQIDYTFSSLKASTNYKLEVIVTNGNGMDFTYQYDQIIRTSGIGRPTIIAEKEPSNPRNSYLKKQVDNVSFPISEGYSYYIKSTKAASISSGVLGKCGSGVVPIDCEEESVTTLQADYWYKVAGNIHVTYATDSNETGTLLAMLSNGVNDSSTSDFLFKIDTTSPEVALKKASATSNSVTIPLTIIDAGSGIKEVVCKYSTTSGSYTINGTLAENSTKCILNNIKENTTYYYQVCASDMIENEETCSTGSTESKDISNPVILFTNTPTSAIDGYVRKQIANIKFDSSNMENPYYYIKTGRKGVSSLNISEVCGSEMTPGSCTSITSTKNLDANMWYKVSGDVNITYETESNSNHTLYAITYDGTNYSGTTTGTILKIDSASPTVVLGKAMLSDNSAEGTDSNSGGKSSMKITIPFTASDNGGSGIKNVTCKYSTTKDSYIYNANSISETSCTIENITTSGIYYYQVCASDMVGNEETCSTGSIAKKDITNPIIAFTNTPATAVNGYVEKQVANINFTASNLENPNYYIKTGRVGVSNLNVSESCGTGIMPSDCTSITSTKNLGINTWYKVSGNVNITYESGSNSTHTLYAVTYDGMNHSEAATGTLLKIDKTPPTIVLKGAFFSSSSTTNSSSDSNSGGKSSMKITIPFTASDNSGQGVKNVTCKYSTTEGSYIYNANSISNTECVINDVSTSEVYYYQICASDIFNNQACKVGSSDSSISTLRLGTYVKYIPPTTSYTISADRTGYSEQTINPSELTLWRIIKTNEDGTVELVSADVSSTTITFSGQSGYLRYIKTLNEIAKQYEDRTYTIGSRHMGYDSSAKEELTSIEDSSDEGYSRDMNLVQDALGTLKPSSGTSGYFLASRGGAQLGPVRLYIRVYQDSLYKSQLSYYSAIRPIIVLKSGLIIKSGSGTLASPYQIQ